MGKTRKDAQKYKEKRTIDKEPRRKEKKRFNDDFDDDFLDDEFIISDEE